MSTLEEAIREVRAAVEEMAQAAERAAPAFTAPRAAGKWSPSQVTEHVARALEESANQVRGLPSKLPTLPALARPLARILFFNRVVRGARFQKARTNAPMDPERGPATPSEARVRLEQALSRLEHACRESAPTEPMNSPTFGRVSVSDFVRFQAAHTKHHTGQIPGT